MTDTQSPQSENSAAPPAPDNIAGVGHRHVGPLGTALLSLYLLAFTALLGYSLLCFWIAASAEDPKTLITVHYLSFKLDNFSYESLLLIIVALCGAIGSMVHALRSISWYIGNRELRRSWVIKYLMQPFVGGTLALVFYFVLRAGLFSTQASVQSASLLGFAGISSLVGMFSDQAVLKLKVIAETVLTRPEAGADAVPQDDPKHKDKNNIRADKDKSKEKA